MRTDPTSVNPGTSLSAALLVVLVATAVNALLLAAPPDPAASAVRITQGARTFVPAGSVVPLPADLVSTVRVSYDQAGNHLISPPGSTSGTYKVSTANPGWVHVWVQNTGLRTAPDGTPQPPSFAILIRLSYPHYTGNYPTGTVVTVVKDYPFTELLKAGGAYHYFFSFDPLSFKIYNPLMPGSVSQWYSLTIEVKVDLPNVIRESNETNNNSTYTVNFTS